MSLSSLQLVITIEKQIIANIFFFIFNLFL